MYHALIFTGISKGPTTYYRAIGAYRIRTELESVGYNVKIIDFFQHLSDSNIVSVFEKYVSDKTLWVGFSTTFVNCKELLDTRIELFNELKKKYKIKFVIGGAKTSDGQFQFADYIVTGNADNAVIALTDFLSNKTQTLNYREYQNKIIVDGNKDYDRKDLTNIDVIWKKEDRISKNFTMPIELSRGCIFKCAFCQYPLTGKKKFDYVRAKESIIEEFIRNYENFGITQYQFLDDTYNDSMIKMEYMHEAISALPFQIRFDAYIKPELLVRWPEQIPLLAEMGLRGCSLGIESFNPKTRAAIQKMPDIDRILLAVENLKNKTQNKAKIQMNLITGLPHETEESMARTQEFAINCNFIDYWTWWPLQILNSESSEYLSPIEKNPTQYGYEIHIPIQTNFKSLAKQSDLQPISTYWKNQYTDLLKATELAKKFNIESQEKIKLGGWLCGAVSSLGIDIDKHYEDNNGLYSMLPHDSMIQRKQYIINDYIKHNIHNDV
jgi:radical SAM superfamily enzyme YgiQ (UPF0313 family)